MSAQTTRDQSTLCVARRRPAGDVGVHRRGPPTTTRTADCRLWRQRRPGQMAPRPGRGRAQGAVPRSRFRRNPEGAWVLLGSAIVRSPKVARPRMRASLPLLLLDDPHRDRLRRRALRSPHFHSPIWKFARSGTLRVNTHARDPLYFHHGLLARALDRTDLGQRRNPPRATPLAPDLVQAAQLAQLGHDQAAALAELEAPVLPVLDAAVDLRPDLGE